MRTSTSTSLFALAASAAFVVFGSGILAGPGGAPGAASKDQPNSIFEASLLAGRDAVAKQRWDDAAIVIQRALERDPKSPEAWELRAQWGEGVGDKDEQVFALHKELALLVAQKGNKKQIDAIRTKLEALDPVASDLFKLREGFIDKLEPIAEQYEKEKRPHSAIRVLQEVLALDPERETAQAAIERISASPDPTLAETAKPKDLLADVSDAWIRDHDEKHKEWKERAKLERDHYITTTDAGYEVLVRSAEAMEQMNAFYRQFFWGEKGKDRAVGRIELHIFKNRAEYLKLGQSPVEWSGGQFTGSAVETYIGDGGYEETVTTLFHEAAHQFVSLATSAAGWLNEGLASFFEGCRMLSNGTVQMNMPANHRLFPLVQRMNKGWMKDSHDGISDSNASQEPDTAPTFRIVLENKYAWGPPWYAPTWGVVYFLYNYQDPADGRFIYRKAFMEFIDASSGRSGEGAVENFEKVVLDNPQRPSPGLPSSERIKLVKTVDELNDVWFQWMVQLADEQSGRLKAERPYLQWARYARKRGEWEVATEHFEKGAIATPNDIDLLSEFADHLAEHAHDTDRAAKLVLQALRVAEAGDNVDEKRVDQLEAQLARFDPKRETLDAIHRDLWKKATAIVQKYMDAKLYMMAMEVSSHLGSDLSVPGMFSAFEKAARESKKSIQLWQLAYNEQNLDGWSHADPKVWQPYGGELWATFGQYKEDDFNFQFLGFDKITSGDFSMEAEVLAEKGECSFCGLAFGKKGGSNFHAIMLFGGREADPAKKQVERDPEVQISTIYGANASKMWVHIGIGKQRGWHKLRFDITGGLIDLWVDGQFTLRHDFESADVLRGSFGLVMGPGSAKFRNVRYLARNPRDPGAAIERAIKFEKLEKESGGGAIGGSWKDKVPPFPQVKTWVQGNRAAWDERGPVPQLLVFWSMPQNDVIPIDAWLSDVAKRYSDVGLDVIEIAQFDSDPDALTAYLQKHPMPGSVGIDWKDPGRAGGGASFEVYSIARFKMPRVILLDVDGKVFWEGDPGIESSKGWKPGMDTFADDPIAELVKRRNLHDLGRWRRAWEATGAEALGRGDLKTAFPLLDKARELPAQKVEIVAVAQRWLRALESALASGEATAASLAQRGYEPAGKILLEWADIIGKPPESKAKAALARLASSPSAQDWQKAVKIVEKANANAKKGSLFELARATATELRPLQGKLPSDLAARLVRAADGRNEDAIKEILANVEREPAVFLVYEFAAE